MRLKTTLFLALFFVVSLSLKAAHFSAGYITYQYIGDSTGVSHQYLVRLNLIRSTGGINFGRGNINLTITSSCSPDIVETLLYQAPTNPSGLDNNGTDIKSEYLCSNNSTNFVVYKYKAVITLPGTCTDYTFIPHMQCCRDLLDNINASGKSLGIYTLLNNSFEENSLPEPKLEKLIPELCRNITYTISGFGPDKDYQNGYYRPAPAINSTNNYTVLDTIPFRPNYTVNEPVPVNQNSYQVDSASGIISLEPNSPGHFVVPQEYVDFKLNINTGTYYRAGLMHMEFITRVFASCPYQISNGPEVRLGNRYRVDSAQCGDSSHILWVRNSLDTASISSDYSEFKAYYKSSGIPLPITGLDILTGDSLRIYFADTLSANDTLAIYTTTGSDGDGLMNRCNFEQATHDTLSLLIGGCNGISLLENRIPKLEVYPVPSRGKLTFKGGGARDLKLVNVYSLSGAKVSILPVKEGKVDASHLDKGSYLLRFQNPYTGLFENHQIIVL